MREINFDQYKDKAIVVAYPNNWAKWHSKWSDFFYKIGIATNQYYKVGHAAVLLVECKTGNIEYYDFGRYTTGANDGRVRSVNTDPNLAILTNAKIDNEDNISNLKDIILELDSKKIYTHGHGEVIYSVCNQIDFKKAKKYIDRLVKQCCIPYSPFAKNATNCSRFVAQVITNNCNDKGIIKMIKKQSTFTPTPVGNVINATHLDIVEMHENAIFKKLVKTRKTEFWDTITNVLKSTKVSDKKNNEIHYDAIATPKRPNNIPRNAQWLNGIGEGAWISIIELIKHKYLIQRHDTNGGLDYQVVGHNSELNIKKDYKIDYNSNRLVTTIIQNNKTIKLAMNTQYLSIKTSKII